MSRGARASTGPPIDPPTCGEFSFLMILRLAFLLLPIAAFAQQASFIRPSLVPLPGIPLQDPFAVTAGDWNGDGLADLAVANRQKGSVLILLGDGKGGVVARQEIRSGNAPVAIVSADLNGDQILDLAVANTRSGTVSILHGVGDGSFQPAPPLRFTQPPLSLAAGDLNGDGRADLVVSRLPAGLTVFLAGEGGFRTLELAPAIDGTVVLADFNRDRKLDIAVGQLSGTRIVLLAGNGDGTFQSEQMVAAPSDSGALASADFNNDGVADLVGASRRAPGAWVLLGRGDLSFEPPRPLAAAAGHFFLTTGDFNGDGRADVAIANFGSSNVSAFWGNGDGTFRGPRTYGTGPAPAGITSADLDGDGLADIAVTDTDSSTLSVLLGDEESELIDAARFGSFQPRALLVGDFTSDGAPDVAVLNSGDDSLTLLDGAQGELQPVGRTRLGGGATEAVSADFNRDGVPDIAVAHPATNEIWILLARPGGTFDVNRRLRVGPVRALQAVDLNRDGYAELVYAFADQLMVVPNGAEGFGTPRGQRVGFVSQMIAGELTGDQTPDLALINERGLVLLAGRGDGTFGAPIDVLGGRSIRSLAVGDFNGDQRLDLAAFISDPGTALVLLNQGNGELRLGPELRLANYPAGIAVADFDQDGRLDLAVTHEVGASVSVAFGRGDGTFQGLRQFNTGGFGPVAVVAADLDRDRRPELIIANQAGSVVIFRNSASPAETPPPSAPRLTQPADGEVIPQTDRTTGCQGYEISFSWEAPPAGEQVVGYEFTMGRGGTARITQSMPVTPGFFVRQCENTVPDDQLEGWEWRLQARDQSGRLSEPAVAAFRFGQCRRPDGSPCAGESQAGSAAIAPLSTPRAGHTATLLPDGRVLIAGGTSRVDGRVRELATAELWEPNPPPNGRFVPAGNMRAGRASHRATALADGRVLISGGLAFQASGQPTALASCELFDPGTGQFAPAGSLTQARASHSAVRLSDGRVAMLGGSRLDSPAALASVEIYQPASNSFAAAGSLRTGRSQHTATLLDSGRLLVVGGGPGAELYDPAAGASSEAGSPALTRSEHAAVPLPDGRALIVGGISSGVPTPLLEIYDPAANSFSMAGSLSAGRRSAEATRNGGTVLITGGNIPPDGNRVATVEAFDVLGRTVTLLPPLSAPRSDHTATLLRDGRILITGGTTGADQTADFTAQAEIYSLQP